MVQYYRGVFITGLCIAYVICAALINECCDKFLDLLENIVKYGILDMSDGIGSQQIRTWVL
jgi:hypothetical protein